MKPTISSKYKETRLILTEKIRGQEINPLEVTVGNHVCYFCKNLIKENGIVLAINEGLGLSSFCIDEGCYYEALLSHQPLLTPF